MTTTTQKSVLSQALIFALENFNEYDDGGFYREYQPEYGQTGNDVSDVMMADDLLMMSNLEKNQFIVPVTFTYGHGSKYDSGDYVTDVESCLVFVDLNTQECYQLNSNYEPFANGFVELTEEEQVQVCDEL